MIDINRAKSGMYESLDYLRITNDNVEIRVYHKGLTIEAIMVTVDDTEFHMDELDERMIIKLRHVINYVIAIEKITNSTEWVSKEFLSEEDPTHYQTYPTKSFSDQN